MAGSRSAAAVYRTEIQEGIDAGLTAQRIYQDLVAEYSYGHSYESVKRFVRKLAPKREAVGVMHSATKRVNPRIHMWTPRWEGCRIGPRERLPPG